MSPRNLQIPKVTGLNSEFEEQKKVIESADVQFFAQNQVKSKRKLYTTKVLGIWPQRPLHWICPWTPKTKWVFAPPKRPIVTLLGTTKNSRAYIVSMYELKKVM